MTQSLMNRITIFGLFLVICTSVQAQKKLLVLGSSTSACYGPSSYDSCYLGRLQQHYQLLGTPFTIANLAIGGSNVYQGMPTGYNPPPGRNAPWPEHNITTGLQGNPDVVLINYPSNGYDVFSVDEVLFCLRTIKETANSAGKPCYITTTQPRSDPEAYQTPAVRSKMAGIKERVLNEFGSFAINFWDGIVNPTDSSILSAYDADGTHLNNAGHSILFNRVLEKNIFDQPPPPPVLVPLAITNASFTATKTEANVHLAWKGFSTNIQSSFSIERSHNGKDFLKIGLISTVPIRTETSYSFTDTKPLSGDNYYRLKFTNAANVILYSSVIAIKTSGSIAGLQVYPSPAKNNLQWQITEPAGEVTGRIINMSGTTLYTFKLRSGGFTTYSTLDVSWLVKGSYILMINRKSALFIKQ